MSTPHECARIESIVEAADAGALSTEHREHLDECAICAATLAALEQVDLGLSLFEDTDVTDAFVAGVLAAVDAADVGLNPAPAHSVEEAIAPAATKPASPPRRWRAALMYAAAALIVCGLSGVIVFASRGVLTERTAGSGGAGDERVAALDGRRGPSISDEEPGDFNSPAGSVFAPDRGEQSGQMRADEGRRRDTVRRTTRSRRTSRRHDAPSRDRWYPSDEQERTRLAQDLRANDIEAAAPEEVAEALPTEEEVRGGDGGERTGVASQGRGSGGGNGGLRQQTTTIDANGRAMERTQSSGEFGVAARSGGSATIHGGSAGRRGESFGFRSLEEGEQSEGDGLAINRWHAPETPEPAVVDEPNDPFAATAPRPVPSPDAIIGDSAAAAVEDVTVELGLINVEQDDRLAPPPVAEPEPAPSPAQASGSASVLSRLSGDIDGDGAPAQDFGDLTLRARTREPAAGSAGPATTSTATTGSTTTGEGLPSSVGGLRREIEAHNIEVDELEEATADRSAFDNGLQDGDFEDEIAGLDGREQAGGDEFGYVGPRGRYRGQITDGSESEQARARGEELAMNRRASAEAARNQPAQIDAMQNAAAYARYMAAREQVDGVQTVAARGYWRNTYVPGDRDARRAAMRLGDTQGSHHTTDPLFDAAAQEVFDRPDSSSMALYVNSDRRAINGPTRMSLEVALLATDVSAGRRPTLDAAIVLDLRTQPDARTIAEIEEALMSLEARREPGDTIRVFAAGPHGGLVFDSGELRRGAVDVLLRSIQQANAPEIEGRDFVETELGTAYSAAVASLNSGDADSILGSRMVWLWSPSLSEADASSLIDPVHNAGRDSIVTSVLSLNANAQAASHEAIEELAITGQGSWRWSGGADGAGAAVNAEVDAQGRVVARALRLSIRLAPGVRLVDVLGSERLDAADAQRVREMEVSVDQAMARSLGIEADRGEDEDGIQIVIPAFYAGDTHVITLDVIAERPGNLADVTMRYKDLLLTRNATVRGQNSVERGARARGPIEQNVARNQLSFECGEVVREVIATASQGEGARAAAELEDFARVLTGAAQQTEDRRGRSALENDAAALREFSRRLRSGEATASNRQLLDAMLLFSHARSGTSGLSIHSLRERAQQSP